MEQSDDPMVKPTGNPETEQDVIVAPLDGLMLGVTVVKTEFTVPVIGAEYVIVGIPGLTRKGTVASAEVPAKFVATTVKFVKLASAVGVPEITQVVGFTVNPVGNAVVLDLIPQPVMFRPFEFKEVGEMLRTVP